MKAFWTLRAVYECGWLSLWQYGFMNLIMLPARLPFDKHGKVFLELYVTTSDEVGLSGRRRDLHAAGSARVRVRVRVRARVSFGSPGARSPACSRISKSRTNTHSPPTVFEPVTVDSFYHLRRVERCFVMNVAVVGSNTSYGRLYLGINLTSAGGFQHAKGKGWIPGLWPCR